MTAIQMKHLPAPDVFVLRVPTPADVEAEDVQRIARSLKRQNRRGSPLSPNGALVVIVVGDADLEGLDEDEMRRHGWVRADERAA